MTTTLITGATGNVGIETIRCLLREHPECRFTAGVRSIAEGRAVFERERLSGFQLVEFDFERTESIERALHGIHKLFLLRPPQIADVEGVFVPLIAAAKRAGVEHIVFLSLQGVENNSWTPHHKIEAALRASGRAYTFLRPSFFMQNLSTTLRASIRDRHEISVPAGEGKTNFIDVRDIGEIAAMVLSDPSQRHINQGYELTGNEAYSYHEVAAMLSDEIGVNIVYSNPSALKFFWHTWRVEKAPVGFAAVTTVLYSIAKFGKAAGYSPEAERLLGRPLVPLRQFIHDHKALWLQ
jgi:uncharacterized protein YbjT (DUF2867 family)